MLGCWNINVFIVYSLFLFLQDSHRCICWYPVQGHRLYIFLAIIYIEIKTTNYVPAAKNQDFHARCILHYNNWHQVVWSIAWQPGPQKPSIIIFKQANNKKRFYRYIWPVILKIHCSFKSIYMKGYCCDTIESQTYIKQTPLDVSKLSAL